MLKFSSISFVAENQLGGSDIIHVVKTLPTFPSASNSVVLSAAAYITWKYPTLKHPWYPNYDLSELQQISESPLTHQSSSLSVHPLFQGWCDIICKFIFKDNAVRKNDELFVLVSVPSETISELEQFGCQKKVFENKVNPCVCFNLEKTAKVNKKIGIMNFATSQLRENQLQPKINIYSLFLGTLFDNQKFDYFQILKGEVPTKQELVEYDSIIMPGSSHSALDCIPEVELLASQLRQALEQNKQLRVLSICFGHQVISKMYGGSIVRKDRFEGQENINFIPQVIDKYWYLSGLKKFIGKQMMMPEHHQDYVETVPNGFQLLANSESCKVQGMVSKCGKILCFQFHPEYLSDYAVAFEKRLIKMSSEYKISFDLSVPEQKIQQHLAACNQVRLCMKRFLS